MERGSKTATKIGTMDNIIRFDTVDDYNRFFGLETLHPLVGVGHQMRGTEVRETEIRLPGRDNNQFCTRTGSGIRDE